VTRLKVVLYHLYARLPPKARRLIVRTIAPSYTVGAMCFIERSDGALLLVRHSYRQRWGVPGGLLERGEAMEDAARREAMEEVGLRIELASVPAVVVDPAPQRVDTIFRCRLAPGVDPASARPASPEIVEFRWFAQDHLPELQFETASALVELGRREIEAGRPPLPDPVWPDFD
jgi:8-oxo-dGTP diphosphatase